MEFNKAAFNRQNIFVTLFSVLILSVTVNAGQQFFHLLALRNQALDITPSAITIETGMRTKLTGTGGTPPYTYSIVSGAGSVNPTNGVYLAEGMDAYTAVVRVTDNLNQTKDAVVTINAAPVIHCGDGDDYVYTNAMNGRFFDSGGAAGDYSNNEFCELEINTGDTSTINVQFHSFNLDPTYDKLKMYDWDWDLTTYSGSTLPSNYSSPNGYLYFEFMSNSTLTSTGYELTWTSTSPDTPTLITYDSTLQKNYSTTFYVSGGVSPYTYSIVSGPGVLSNANAYGVDFTSPTDGTTIVKVTDALGQTSEDTITILTPPLTITNFYQVYGTSLGGNEININGSGFQPGMIVTIGGAVCTKTGDYTYTYYYTCTTPPGTGKVDVVLQNPDLTTVTAATKFEYTQGSWTSMPVPSTANRELEARIWTGDRVISWGGQDPSCTYGSCVKSDGHVYNPVTDSWSAMAASPLAARIAMAGKWTGHEALIFGGRSGGSCLSNGAKYNPYTNEWTTISSPSWSCRQMFSSVWTGKDLIIWGGQWGGVHNTGVAYNPSSNTWRSIASASTARWYHDSIWAGNKMLIYGGTSSTPAGTYPLNAEIYDPETNTWAATSTPNLHPKSNGGYNNYNYMVWTGDRVFVAGGTQSTTATTRHEGFYNPHDNTWSYNATDYFYDNWGFSSSMVWTGNSIVHSSGSTISLLNTATNTVSRLNSVSSKGDVNFLWTGRDLISCYGNSSFATDPDCDKLNLESHNHWLSTMGHDSWTANVSAASAPSARSGSTSVWTGKYFVIWGGTDGSTYLNSGYKYDPFRNLWTPISNTGAPAGRINHTSVWAGNRMIIWGGQTAAGTQTNTGAVYDFETDSWSSTDTSGAPSEREDHTVSWTGGRMLIWGGKNSSGPLGDGFIYNPSNNSWTTMATTGSPPTARSGHQALWTGSKMIIWGGADGATTLTNTGAAYELSTNTWTALTDSSAPSARRDFSIVLAKNKFVIWGGADALGGALDTGAIYDLSLNTWTAVSSSGAPTARSKASTVYTDRSMIVWGGVNGATNYSDGFLLNPETNMWSSITSSGLSGRYGAMAAWTGGVGDGLGRGSNTYRNNYNGDTGRLIIWGGFDGTTYKADGKIYALPNQ